MLIDGLIRTCCTTLHCDCLSTPLICAGYNCETDADFYRLTGRII